MSRNVFRHLVSLLEENQVASLDEFTKVVKEEEAVTDLLESLAWRSAKSVVKSAMKYGLSYVGHSKTELYELTKLARRRSSS